MNTRAIRRLRALLAANQPAYGLWITLESPSVAEMAVAFGFDWITIDAEHGHLDWKEIVDHLRATVRSETAAFVRIAERSTTLAKRALDLGADGIIVPWIETADQFREALRDCRYPPEGRRGIGGERATAWGQSFKAHAHEANDHAMVIPILESVAGVANAAEIAAVDGAEIFFFGPADHSSSAGFRGEWEGPGVADQIVRAKDTLRAVGKSCGVMVTGEEDLLRRREQGFQLMAVGSDAGLICQSLRRALRTVGREMQPAPSLDAKDATYVDEALPAPPESMRPDRREAIMAPGQGKTITFQPGADFETLAGDFTQARGITTGFLTLAPSGVLDLHTHPCTESITVLEGRAEIAVDGRVYELGPLDNIVIPRWLPHTTRNPHSHAPARLHACLALAPPVRQPSAAQFAYRRMPAESTGVDGFERITRHATASRSLAIGTGTEVVDYVNAQQVPGVEISGGYARFAPQGRLPAHVHDFDESICIIEGEATCVVEGRRYALRDGATATVPRGRVHYFVNESLRPMAMIWFYAGPMPVRIVVSEACASQADAPWL